MFFSKIFQILFIFGSTSPLFIIPECLNDSWWCFSSSFSDFEDRRRVSLKSCSILFKIRDSSLLPSSHNYLRLWEFFSPIRSNSRVFSVWLSGVHHFRLFILSFQLAFSNLIGASFEYPLISHDLFVPMDLNPLMYLRSFANFSQCFFIFTSFFSNSYGGSLKTFPSWRDVYFNPFYENK